MLKVKIFDNPKEDDINEFLKTTSGSLVDIKFIESVESLAELGVRKATIHSSVMIVYEISGPGGMKLGFYK